MLRCSDYRCLLASIGINNSRAARRFPLVYWRGLTLLSQVLSTSRTASGQIYLLNNSPKEREVKRPWKSEVMAWWSTLAPTSIFALPHRREWPLGLTADRLPKKFVSIHCLKIWKMAFSSIRNHSSQGVRHGVETRHRLGRILGFSPKQFFKRFIRILRR